MHLNVIPPVSSRVEIVGSAAMPVKRTTAGSVYT